MTPFATIFVHDFGEYFFSVIFLSRLNVNIRVPRYCRMYFHYIYKTSINIIFFIKVIANYHVIDFYINFYLIYNVTVFTFCSEFYYMQNNLLFQQ